jgi:hemolysin activation/secretion protein
MMSFNNSPSRRFYIIFIQWTLIALVTICSLEAQAERLSALDRKLLVKTFILDGMSLGQLKLLKTENCFQDELKLLVEQTQIDELKPTLRRLYQENEAVRTFACQENIRKAHARALSPDECAKKNDAPFIEKIINTRLENRRIAVLNVNKELTPEKIQLKKNEITQCYIDNKYINSGAIIPDQEVQNGLIVIRIVEGWLKQVDIINQDSKWLFSLSPNYIKRRLRFSSDEQDILNMNDLQERLQIMQQNPRFKQVVGRVAPGEQLGEGILKTDVGEAKPYQLGFRFNNYRHPSVGAYRGAVELNHDNLLGLGDSLNLRYGLTQGLKDYGIHYSVPFPLLLKYDTTLSLGFNKSDSEVVTEPFSTFGVESDTETWSLGLRQPLYKSYPPATNPNDPNAYKEWAIGLRFEKRRNTTFLEGEPFSFSRGAKNGLTEYAAMRLSSEWLNKSQYNVLAAHGTLSYGTGALDPTIDEKLIDKHFRTLLLQVQWFGRLEQWLKRQRHRTESNLAESDPLLSPFWARIRESNLLFRTNIQWTDQDKELIPLEKFSLGGHASVRGYRESELLRDKAITATLEWRLPLGHLPIYRISEPGDGKIDLIPFYDYGKGWHNEGPGSTPKDISSAGIGLQWTPIKNLYTQLYWARKFRNIRRHADEEYDLQDESFHFEISFRWPASF